MMTTASSRTNNAIVRNSSILEELNVEFLSIEQFSGDEISYALYLSGLRREHQDLKIKQEIAELLKEETSQPGSFSWLIIIACIISGLGIGFLLWGTH